MTEPGKKKKREKKLSLIIISFFREEGFSWFWEINYVYEAYKIHGT